MIKWGWSKSSAQRSVGDVLPMWLKAFSMAVPWITILFLYIMIAKMGAIYTSANGTLFDLPDSSVTDVSETTAVVLVIYSPKGPLIYFDSTRYELNDDRQMNKFRSHLEDRISYAPTSNPTLLINSDARISMGQIQRIIDIARESGVTNIMMATDKKDNQAK